ncbi:phage tail assembly chaperone [Bacillus sp. JJ722]|uniref:phage tail assembly chaperone n=1 Tax=Bacillus sp. JJ722 TaxID=3122973 RepID=UPI0030001FCE
MDALQALLTADLHVTKEVIIDRLGVAFVIKPLDGKQIQQITKEASFGNSLDEYKFGAIAIAKSCENVDFKDAKLLKKYEVSTAEDCVQKALFAGEIALLQQEIMNVSGFKNINKQVREAKN